MNLTQILYTQRRLNSFTDDLNTVFNEFLTFYQENKPVDEYKFKKEKLALKLMPYLTNGITYDNAKRFLSIQLNLPIGYISKTLDSYYYNHLSHTKPYKVYTCHKLHDAGINNVTIAKLLNLSPATIKKYLLIPNKLE